MSRSVCTKRSSIVLMSLLNKPIAYLLVWCAPLVHAMMERPDRFLSARDENMRPAGPGGVAHCVQTTHREIGNFSAQQPLRIRASRAPAFPMGTDAEGTAM